MTTKAESVTEKCGQTAYLEYARIHAEEGITLPKWSTLPHVKRLAFEAVAFHFQRGDEPESAAYEKNSRDMISGKYREITNSVD